MMRACPVHVAIALSVRGYRVLAGADLLCRCGAALARGGNLGCGFGELIDGA